MTPSPLTLFPDDDAERGRASSAGSLSVPQRSALLILSAAASGALVTVDRTHPTAWRELPTGAIRVHLHAETLEALVRRGLVEDAGGPFAVTLTDAGRREVARMSGRA